jgi:hypothetical protein
VRNTCICLLLINLSLLAMPEVCFSQQRTQSIPERRVAAPDTILNPSALTFPQLDSLQIIRPDTVPKSDTTNVVPKSEIQTTINYYAEDSIITDFTQNRVYLYNDAWFEYGNIRLDADLIIIDWEKSELFASGITDSLGNINRESNF